MCNVITNMREAQDNGTVSFVAASMGGRVHRASINIIYNWQLPKSLCSVAALCTGVLETCA